MKSIDFLAEGEDNSPEDVKENHPEVHRFIQSILGPYAVRDAKVDTYDLGNNHYVVFKVKPSAGLGNTKAVLKGNGVDFDEQEARYNGDSTAGMLIGDHNGIGFEINNDKVRGNSTQTWTFKLPKNDELEEALGSNLEDTLKRFHKKHYIHNGRPGLEAVKTGPDQITVSSLDDGEQTFVGSIPEFEAWASSLNEGDESEIAQAKRNVGVMPTDSYGVTTQDIFTARGHAVIPKGKRVKISQKNGVTYLAKMDINNMWGSDFPINDIDVQYITHDVTEDDRDFDDGNVKVKFGKSKPFKAPSFDDSMRSLIDRVRPRPQRDPDDVDDGSRGLSNRDRNR